MALLPQTGFITPDVYGPARSAGDEDFVAAKMTGLDRTPEPRRRAGALTGRLGGLAARLAVVAVTAAAGLALGLSAPPAANAMEVGTPITSGLSWRSGAAADESFGRWRGRDLDVRVVYVQHDSFSRMYAQLRNAFFKNNCQQTPLCVVSTAMLTRDKWGQFRQCAAGAFDSNHREVANLIASARRGAIIRLGWEANSRGDHPWKIGTESNIAPYKECYRRLARIYRGAGLRTEWSVAKGGAVDAYSTYPGNDVVDFWGLHYYDSGKEPKQEIGAWLAKAREHGKKLNVPEWGIWKHGDNAAYIERMNTFFRANAAHIGYESYFNKNSEHELYPSTKWSKARAAYARLW